MLKHIRSNVLLNSFMLTLTVAFIGLYAVSRITAFLYILSLLFLYWAAFFWLWIMEVTRRNKDEGYLGRIAEMEQLKEDMRMNKPMLGDRWMALKSHKKVHEIFKAKRNYHLLGVMFALNLIVGAFLFIPNLLGLVLTGINVLFLVWHAAWLAYFAYQRRKWENKRISELENVVSALRTSSQQLSEGLSGLDSIDESFDSWQDQ